MEITTLSERHYDPIKCVPSGFARQLEAELTEALETSAVRSRIVNKQMIELEEARAELERKDKLIEQMRDALRLAKDGLVCADYSGVEDDIERIEAALEAAEGGVNNNE